MDEISAIRSNIKEKSLSWLAGETSLSRLTKPEKMLYLGLVVPEDEKKCIQELLYRENARSFENAPVFIYPDKWDWRQVSGKNWTTPIRDQKQCGSCVAFATVALIESNLEIFRRNPDLNPDLSEADLFFRGCGSCCDLGWYYNSALIYAQQSGIPDEACFPYDSDQLRSCPDREKRIVKINSWKTLLSASQAKEWLATRGPLMTGMNVYEDFYYYSGGIYKEAYGSYMADHAVCIVGYNDAQGYWICKNSWGVGWGENGWFKIGYGECGIGKRFAFYAVQFTSDDDLIMPKQGRVIVRFKGMNTTMVDEIWQHSPESRLIFSASSSQIGKFYDLGVYPSGTRLIFALKTSDGHVYYTDQFLNSDACDHVKKVKIGTYKWALSWEDRYGLGEKDYDDVVMETEIISPITEDIVMPKDGRVFVTPKSILAFSLKEFLQCSPKNRLILNEETPLGKGIDLGSFSVGAKLSFALKTDDGYTYYTDLAKNPDLLSHVRKLPIGYNKWELRWETSPGLKKKIYKDLVVEIEVIPTIKEDVVLAEDSHVAARLVSKNTPYHNRFGLFRPESKLLFDCISENVGKSSDVGDFPAKTRLVFAVQAQDGNIYYTDSSLNGDGKSHVLKLPLGSGKCLLRWEDLYALKDHDYNDLVVEIILTTKNK
ncbi:MAG: C1 family peptidase [Methanothrix sp.]